MLLFLRRSRVSFGPCVEREKTEVNDNIGTRVYRHHGISASNAREARVLVDMPSESDLNAHIEDLDDRKQYLENDAVYQKVVQDRLTGGYSFPREEVGHDVAVESMAAIAEEKDRILRFKTETKNISGMVSHASGTCRAIPSRTYEDGALVLMDWALLESAR